MPFTHVLVPRDLSDRANHARRCALEEATMHRARVTVLHVLPPSADTDVYYVTGSPESTTQGRFDPVIGGRLGSQPPPSPTVVRRDPNEEVLTRLQDLMR